jgi:hypothetical protein
MGEVWKISQEARFFHGGYPAYLTGFRVAVCVSSTIMDN